MQKSIRLGLSAFNVSNLPVAPRATLDIDVSHVPNDPPFVAYVANLSFELDEAKLRTVFVDLNVNERMTGSISLRRDRVLFLASKGSDIERWNTQSWYWLGRI